MSLEYPPPPTETSSAASHVGGISCRSLSEAPPHLHPSLLTWTCALSALNDQHSPFSAWTCALSALNDRHSPFWCEHCVNTAALNDRHKKFALSMNLLE